MELKFYYVNAGFCVMETQIRSAAIAKTYRRFELYRILQKCFGYIRPLCRKITGTRKSTNAEDRRPRRVKIWRKLPCTGARRSTRVDDIDRRARKSWSNLPQASPYIAYSTNNWCDIESPIDEAVLHCKRSTDK
ncbi:uncharacterized protein LOC126654142 isoform X2 [Mercurialis annua]|uniref:uncharacterized protein LOC126654142 isoform X2 n=1 Tax=Mercurialis annua TaxID=3986 RepID=UPI002160A1EE|nr:uncharacterized protein LOC126654142 isoform X2 [Mercurialis annua]